MTKAKSDSKQDSEPNIGTASPEKPTTDWKARILGTLALVLFAVALYYALQAFIPRWWAQRIGDLGQGGFTRSITWGLILGFVFTLVPLLLLLFGGCRIGRWAGKFFATASFVFAVILAMPNLMTLSIVLGIGDGARAGERILDNDAPGFRVASLTAAIVAALVFAIVWIFVIRYRQRGQDLRRERAIVEEQEAELARERDLDRIDRKGSAGARESDEELGRG